jgi:hypothetical protein
MGVVDQRRSDDKMMEVTDNKWLGAIVYSALISHVDVVRILQSAWPRNTPGWWRYILKMAFKLVTARSKWDLKRNAQ